MRQNIRIVTTADGVRLGWAKVGTGPVLVKAANWLTHLQYDWDSPVWRHWISFFADHTTFVRFDERGCGMSDRQVDDVSDANWLPDLETVIDAAGIPGRMILLGISQGVATAIRFATRHPERVSHLILYGGYAQGWALRGEGEQAHYRAVLEMMRLGWGSNNPVYRQVFTARFIPEATHEQVEWFNELCLKSTTPEMAVRLLEARSMVDIRDLLDQVQVPTLVLHARHDDVAPFSGGRQLASTIPGADFVELDSRNHILLEHEPAWDQFKRAVLDFVAIPESRGCPGALESLTRREREILDLLCQGWPNGVIADRLCLSEKTVRNHLSNLYRKLGVTSRTQAVVRMHEEAPPGT